MASVVRALAVSWVATLACSDCTVDDFSREVDDVGLLQIGKATPRLVDSNLNVRRQALLQMRTSVRQARARKGLASARGGKGILIGFLSGANNTERRTTIRESCLPAIKEARRPYFFFVGRPNAPDGIQHKGQGSWATTEEMRMATALRKEQERFGDLHVLPFLESYADLSDKVSAMFDFGMDEGYDVILKIDDDSCPNMETIDQFVEDVKPDEHSAAYFGAFAWNGTEYEAMTGPGNEHVSYFGGPCYGLTRALANIIYREQGFDTELYETYGTDSEDNNMGRWFARARHVHRNDNNTVFTMRTVPEMCRFF